MPREKNRYKDDRSLSSSSDSSYERKKPKSKHKKRSRSRDRISSKHHKSSASHSKHKRKSYSRSVSREKYESKSKKYYRSRSRSSSRSRSKYSRSRRKSLSASRSSTFDIEPALKKTILDDIDVKVDKAIKAAKAAGLTMTKLPTYEEKDIEIKEEMPTIFDRNLLEELNSDSFQQKSFTSSKSKKKSQNIVIDLNAETVINVPEAKVHQEDSIINFDEVPCEEELKEMWIKKLYQYRKKMLRGEI